MNYVIKNYFELAMLQSHAFNKVDTSHHKTCHILELSGCLLSLYRM